MEKLLSRVVLLLLLSCCSEAPSAPSKPLIAFSFAELKEERWKRDRDLFLEEAESLGAHVLVADANGDSQQQIEQNRQLMLKGAKVLVVVPKNALAGVPIIKEAHRRGVKVISYDRMMGSKEEDPDYFVSFDNYRVGRIQAEEVARRAPRGKYLLLGGDPADLNAQIIHDAHQDALNPYLRTGAIEIVGDRYCDRWGRSEATRFTEDVLAKHPDLTAIVAANDGIAGGAIAALRAKGRAGQVMVSGQDADLEACRNLAEGVQTVTVYKPIRQLAQQAAKLAVELARGVDPSTLTGTSTPLTLTKPSPNASGEYLNERVPSLLLDPIPVTRDSLELVINDGFHSREAVFGMGAS